MITLAFGQMAYFVAGSLAPYGGDDGLTLKPRSTLSRLSRVRQRPRASIMSALAVPARLVSALPRRGPSRFGRVFRGARENPTRMATIGFDVFRYQLVAYVIAGCIGGLAGFLLANATEFVSPAYMSWQRSGELIIMVLFGGLGTLHGAIVGAAAYLLLEDLLGGLHRALEGDLRAAAGADRAVRARRADWARRQPQTEAWPWLTPCCGIDNLHKSFGGARRHRRRLARHRRRRTACRDRPQRRRQDHADQPDLRPA